MLSSESSPQSYSIELIVALFVVSAKDETLTV